MKFFEGQMAFLCQDGNDDIIQLNQYQCKGAVLNMCYTKHSPM